VAEELGSRLCNLLPAFHALTGCDSTSGLHQIGKKKAWKYLVDNVETNSLLQKLEDELPPPSDAITSAEMFICALYTTSVRAGRTADDVK